MPSPGDFFVVYDGSSISAKVIEAFTASHFYHAGIYVGGPWVIEAQPKGVSYAPIREWRTNRVLWSHIDLTDEQRKTIILTARNSIGIPYSWLDILALGLSEWGIEQPWVWDRLARSDRLICSQLVAKCYTAAGVDLIDKAACRVTPADLGRLVSNGQFN